MVMLVAAVLIVALLVHFITTKNANSNEIDTTTLENYLSPINKSIRSNQWFRT
jgi:hypothetical protein